MKIVFIIDKFPSLSETFVLNQITGMMDLGNKVKIFAWRKPDETIIHEDVLKYELMKNAVYYVDIVPANKIYRAIKAMIIVLRELVVNYKIIINSLNIRKYGKKAISLELLLLSIYFKDADVLLCHFGPNGILGALMKQAGIKAKVVTIFHGYDMTTYLEKNKDDIYQNLFKYGDLFLPVCNYWRQKLIELGCNENKLKVHHMGIDLKKYEYINKIVKEKDTIKLLTVGRLIEKKGYEYLIKALAIVLKTHENIESKFVGDGPLKEYLEDMVCKLGISNNVQFVGPVTQERVVELYRESSIFILPSINEGLPVVLMEALATGLPVIATNIGGIPEVVSDGKSGFLVPSKDVVSLAARIELLIRRKDKRMEMGKYGRRYIESEFDINKLNKQLIDLLKKA